MTINLLTITFANELKHHEVPLFRGAVNAVLESKNILFHNHTANNGLRYRYPLIQYKVLHGRAAMVCIGQGATAVSDFFEAGNLSLMIGNRYELFEPEKIEIIRYPIDFGPMRDYQLRRWMPLNSENYRKYKDCQSLASRTVLLESILSGNILSMGKGLGINFERQINPIITDILSSRQLTVKGVKKMSFDIAFSCDLALPAFIGLGKHASLDHGVVFPINPRRNI